MKPNKKDFIDWIQKLSSTERFAGSPLVKSQNGCDHAFRATMIALRILDDYNDRNPKNLISREEVLMKVLLHDIEESFTGDLPTPVKYITPEFRAAVQAVEEKAMKEYVLKDVGVHAPEYYKIWKNAKKGISGKIVKLADKLEGLVKINFEINQGNKGLNSAYYETIKWFENNPNLLDDFPMAKVLVDHYRVAHLDEFR